MKIVIEIPDDMIKSLEQGNFGAKYNIYDLVGYIMNGTPLPENHGRLIDADALELDCDWSDYYDGFSAYSESQVRLAPTIIEGSESE